MGFGCNVSCGGEPAGDASDYYHEDAGGVLAERHSEKVLLVGVYQSCDLHAHLRPERKAVCTESAHHGTVQVGSRQKQRGGRCKDEEESWRKDITGKYIKYNKVEGREEKRCRELYVNDNDNNKLINVLRFLEGSHTDHPC